MVPPTLQCFGLSHEIILSFLGRVQLEVVSALLSEKYKLETVVKEPTVIYMERPLKAASHTIHIEVPPNPFWASIGLSVSPLPLGSGMQDLAYVDALGDILIILDMDSDTGMTRTT